MLGKVTTKKQGLPVRQKGIGWALGYQNDSRVGVSGLEEQYEEILRGSDSSYTLNYDSKGNRSEVRARDSGIEYKAVDRLGAAAAGR